VGIAGIVGMSHGRSSFCEQKEAKKLSDRWSRCRGTSKTERIKFFARFFSKKRRFLA
jgi:hypothetical protein